MAWMDRIPYPSVSERFDSIVWAPSWRPLLRTVAADGPAGRELAASLGAPAALADGLASGELLASALVELGRHLSAHASLHLVLTDQPGEVEQSRRAGDTAPLGDLFAAMSGSERERALGSAYAKVRIVTHVVPYPLDVEHAVAMLLSDAALAGGLATARSAAVVQGAGLGPLQIAVLLATLAARADPISELSAWENRDTGESTIEAAPEPIPTRLRIGPELVEIARGALAAAGSDPTADAAVLAAIAAPLQDLSDDLAAAIIRAAWLAGLRSRVGAAGLAGTSVAELSDAISALEAENPRDEDTVTALGWSIAASVAWAAAQRADAGGDALGRALAARRLARARLALARPTAAGIERDRIASLPLASREEDPDVEVPATVAAMRSETVWEERLLEASRAPFLATPSWAGEPRRHAHGILPVGGLLAGEIERAGPSATPPAVAELLSRAGELKELILLVVGNPKEADTSRFAAAAQRLAAALARNGSDGPRVLRLEANPANSLQMNSLLDGVLDLVALPHDEIVVLHHGAAPAVVHASILAAARRGCALRWIRTLPPGPAGDPVRTREFAVDAFIRRQRRAQARRAIVGALLLLRRFAALAELAAAPEEQPAARLFALADALDAGRDPRLLLALAAECGPQAIELIEPLAAADPSARDLTTGWPVARDELRFGDAERGGVLLCRLMRRAARAASRDPRELEQLQRLVERLDAAQAPSRADLLEAFAGDAGADRASLEKAWAELLAQLELPTAGDPAASLASGAAELLL